MPFGMGFGELVMILIIVVVVFAGAAKFPDAGDSLARLFQRGRLSAPRLLLERRRRWTRWDWAAAILAGLLALATLVLLARGR